MRKSKKHPQKQNPPKDGKGQSGQKLAPTKTENSLIDEIDELLGNKPPGDSQSQKEHDSSGDCGCWDQWR